MLPISKAAPPLSNSTECCGTLLRGNWENEPDVQHRTKGLRAVGRAQPSEEYPEGGGRSQLHSSSSAADPAGHRCVRVVAARAKRSGAARCGRTAELGGYQLVELAEVGCIAVCPRID